MDKEIDNKCCVYYHFILCVIAFISCFASIALFLMNAVYNTEDFKRRLKNWKTPPIISISYKNDYLNNLQKRLSQNDEEQLSKMFELKYMDESYDYKYLLIKNTSDKNYHLCGTDSKGNGLYFPNGIKCPINEIEVTKNSNPSKDYYEYTTIKIHDNIYLHYTNNNLFGNIINGFKINILDNKISDNENNNNTFKFNSIDFPLLEIGLKIKFEYVIYNATKHYFGYDNRKILDLYLALNLKKIVTTTFFFLFIIFIILFLFTILILKKSKCSGLHIIIILLCSIVFLLTFILFEIISSATYKIESDRVNIPYSFILFICACFYTFVYIIFFGILNSTNIYYYLVYIIRYGCNCCKNDEPEINQENKREIIEKLNKEIIKLEKKLNVCKKEKEDLNKSKEKIEELKAIHNKFFEENKKKVSNNVEIDIKEIVKIEAEIKRLKVIDKDKIDIFNNLNSQINDIEKKINFYKFEKFKY